MALMIYPALVLGSTTEHLTVLAQATSDVTRPESPDPVLIRTCGLVGGGVGMEYAEDSFEPLKGPTPWENRKQKLPYWPLLTL